MSSELSQWPTEAEAAAMLGTSMKKISRYAAKGLIEIRKRPRDGKKPENAAIRVTLKSSSRALT
jgi:hypothetical protein